MAAESAVVGNCLQAPPTTGHPVTGFATVPPAAGLVLSRDGPGVAGGTSAAVVGCGQQQVPVAPVVAGCLSAAGVSQALAVVFSRWSESALTV